jgi:hypothetical protein
MKTAPEIENSRKKSVTTTKQAKRMKINGSDVSQKRAMVMCEEEERSEFDVKHRPMCGNCM